MVTRPTAPSSSTGPAGPAREPGPYGTADPFGTADADELRARGSLKWTGADGDVAAWVAEADVRPPEVVARALHEAVDRPMLGYLPPAVRTEMARACATWHRDRYGWDVAPEQVRPVGDVLNALRIAIELTSRPGSPVILPTPAYMPFRDAPRAWGREVLEVPMVRDGGRFVLDLDALDEAFAAGGHLLVLVNPHNPTGRVMSHAELEAVAQVVDRHGGRVFADEIHAPLVLPGARHVPYASLSPTTAAHTLTATSASKAWNLAGLKCAQVVLTAPHDVRRWHARDHLLVEGASTLGAIAATAAYDHARDWLDALLAQLDAHRHALATELAGSAVGYVPPEGTYLAWLDLSRHPLVARGHDEAGGLARRLREATGLVTVDGAACGAPWAGWVRLNLAMPRHLVVEAGRRLAARPDQG
ncbi:aminotransferase class I/II-fold pyridoxal phosphate-dependent enzyme [Cellulomonas sp. APG4]|uniref:MalY/PatB family protein n=1 Tax=Cellulomonas sp. APG4 TaxID=1538656 RepID=UPI00137A2BE5|nr:aminotransferase class I/II-fold pyridoxal phosphate-dependent enzyme [Cellulomonas sp. APG4]NCT91400.1 aminotransferase class I/II-fold pyridoxal phosphate-dependent enzyme [Cellulomonas sp. APG4]